MAELGPRDGGKQGASMRRLAVIDVGSNSVRLVIFDGAARSPAYFYNEKVMAGLGAGVAETGKLNPKGRARALAALRRFAALAASIEAPITAVATAAVREAEDGPDFRQEVKAATGIEMVVIDGQEEGRLAARGVLLGWPEADGVVCDMGGSSMEMARLTHGHVGASRTSKLGPLHLREVEGAERDARIEEELAALEPVAGGGLDKLWLVGGSFRAIAKFDIASRNYPLHVLNEYRASPTEMLQSLRAIQAGGADVLRDKAGISSSRAKLTPYAAAVLAAVIERFHPYELVFSSYGLREGLLYTAMPEAMRKRDPLLEAARAMEANAARIPGFGERLYALLLPLFRSLPAQKLRLFRAACLLHDVNWRAHPETRAEMGLELVTRANLAGLTHEDRVFIGLALLFRYSGKRPVKLDAFAALLAKPDQALAEQLGRAMRFGAMFWMKTPGEPGQLALQDDTISLQLTPAGDVLFGEVAEARFAALAHAMGKACKVRRP